MPKDVADKVKPFFETQKLVNYKKKWFFHDHIHKTNKKPDREYLKSIEKKYKVDLGLLASNDRFFNKFNEFYKFSPDETLLILEQECRLFEKILDYLWHITLPVLSLVIAGFATLTMLTKNSFMD